MGPSSRHPATAFREGKPGCGEKPARLLPGAAGCLEETTLLLLSLLGAGGSQRGWGGSPLSLRAYWAS